MNQLSTLTFRILRKLYAKSIGTYQFPPLPCEKNLDKASDLIYDLLATGEPCMIARWGATEISIVVNYLGIQSPNHNIWSFIQGKTIEWWWNPKKIHQMEKWSGFFPSTPDTVSRFSKLMLDDAKEMDICGLFTSVENPIHYVLSYMNNPRYVPLVAYENATSQKPWTRILKGKKVLVVHPFSKLIEKQYKEKRTLLFDNQDSLPEFELQTIQAVQSLGGVSHGFKDWFSALQWMKDEIDKRDYDICLIGCGAYGFPLAAHIKRQGKQAVHIGGSLQLFFGIKGKRWETDATPWGLPTNYYKNLFANSAWVRPDEYMAEQTKNVENGCYW